MISTVAFANSPPLATSATLAAVHALILAHPNLPARRQRDLLGALAAIGKALGQPLDAIPCQPAALQILLGKLPLRQAGFQPTRWRNVRSLLSAALSLAGLVQLPGRLDIPLSPAWSTLLDTAQLPRDAMYRLSRFGRWCTQEGIPPLEVDDAVLARFGAVLTKASLDANPKRCVRNIAVMWNKAATTQTSWPSQRLGVADHRLYYTPEWSTYPASLLADVEAWLTHLGGIGEIDLLSEAAPARPLRPATLKSRRVVLRLYVGALVLSGEDPATLLDLRAIVTPARLRLVLRFFLGRAGNKPTHHTAAMGRLALGIARHWAKAPAIELDQLRDLVNRVTPPRTGMTARNKGRLRPLLHGDAYGQLVQLPEVLCREVERAVRSMPGPNQALALQMQTAVLLEILLLVPMRIKNLAHLRIGRNLLPTPDGRLHIVLQASDTKNGQPMETSLPAEAARLIRRYIDLYRPVLTPGGDWLFPGVGPDRPKSQDALRSQIDGTLAERCGLDFTPHAFRHLAAYKILERDPSAYGLVQSVLGHKSIDTTTRFYCGLEGPRALAHFQELVLARSHGSAAGVPVRRQAHLVQQAR